VIAHPTELDALEAALSTERPRLVRLCARLTGDWSAVEDLAQETLMEACRSLVRLRDADGLVPWLTAIARNVCLRWARSRGRDLAHCAALTGNAGAEGTALDELPADDDDLSLALERDELVALLDRALTLLPTETRQALIGSYVHELPQAELAERLGLSEGALRVRLHRGKLAMRRALATDLREDATAMGIALPDAPQWQETRIWCPFCGQNRLKTRVDQSTGSYAFHCAGSCNPYLAVVGAARHSPLVGELSSPKSILTRHCLTLATEYREALAEAAVLTCPTCGRPLPVRQWMPGEAIPVPQWLYGIHMTCATCGEIWDNATPWHLTMDTPEALHFWRRHPRMRALPTREIEAGGRPALVTGFESLDDHARLELVSARDTYEVLRVFGGVEA
jgi:RNA polymerase sigma-70 factor (ECF subfamily)